MTEDDRIIALGSYEILDSKSEREFDQIVELASTMCNTPIAQISLIDRNRQWIKASHGIAPTETAREYSFCSHALNDPKVIMEVPDSLKDERFKNNPLVFGEPKIRFYAGSPLVTPSGYPIGTLCVIDTKPRRLSAEMKRGLELLAKKVMQYLEIRRDNILLRNELKGSIAKINSLQIKIEELKNESSVGTWQWSAKTRTVTLSTKLTNYLGLQKDDRLGKKIFLKDVVPIIRTLKARVSEEPFRLKHRVKNNRDEVVRVESSILGKWNSSGQLEEILGTITDITLRTKYVDLLEEILFSISHTIRRPISSLQGLMYLLDVEQGQGTSSLKDYSDKIKLVVNEMDNYTRTMTGLFWAKRIQADE